MLLTRWLARNEPDAPAARVLTPTQLLVLIAYCGFKLKPLPANPTVHDVLAAIAQLGGHIRNNGPPGWLVLGRGFDQLLTMEIGYLAARQEFSEKTNTSQN